MILNKSEYPREADQVDAREHPHTRILGTKVQPEFLSVCDLEGPGSDSDIEFKGILSAGTGEFQGFAFAGRHEGETPQTIRLSLLIKRDVINGGS
jgi:hypothetical protein